MSCALENLKERCNSILTAINKIENGAQEYRIGQRTVRRADLETLYREWHLLNAEIERLERPPMTTAVLQRRR